MTDRRPFLDMLGPPLRRAILRHYRPNSCVASTWVGQQVLHELGFASRPISVECIIANPAYTQRFDRLGRGPRSEDEAKRWWTEDGCALVCLGSFDPEHEGHPLENGLHLALLVEDTWLWDLSIDQASRPLKGITITKPFMGNVSLSPLKKSWLKGREAITWGNPNGLHLAYKLKPGDERYKQHPNWLADSKDAEQRKAIAAEAVMALRGLYALSQHV